MIIGGGPAAKAAAGAYREAGGAGSVTILAREADAPYERPPLTKDFLRGESRRDALPLAAKGWYEEHGIDLRTGAMVTEIDLGGPLVRTEGGEEIPFDRLLLATGADPLTPPIPGADGPGVQTMRRIEDAERLGKLGRTATAPSSSAPASSAARPPRRWRCAGSGDDGDAGGGAAARAPRPRGRGGDHRLARIARRRHPAGSRAGRARSAGDASTRARFTDRHEVTVDRVLLALGVERNDGLAAMAGLPVEDGIQVGRLDDDRRTRASSPPATSPSPSTRPPAAACGSNTGARR